MKKAIAVLAVVLFVAPVALADIPGLVDFRAEYTPATQPNWVITKPFQEYANPAWTSDVKVRVDNAAWENLWKYLWLEIDYKTTARYPDLVVTTDNATPTFLGRSTCGSSPKVTWLWRMPQRAWEDIQFPDASYKNLTEIDKIEVTTYCTVNDDFPEPATMSLLALGGLAILRRKKR